MKKYWRRYVMPKVKVEDVEEIELEMEDEAIENGIEKISRKKRLIVTKVRDELARYKNKKQNKGREKNKNE